MIPLHTNEYHSTEIGVAHKMTLTVFEATKRKDTTVKTEFSVTDTIEELKILPDTQQIVYYTLIENIHYSLLTVRDPIEGISDFLRRKEAPI